MTPHLSSRETMRRHGWSIVAIGLGALSIAHTSHAQACAKQDHPAFEFQVDVPATAVPDSTHPHPAANRFAAKTDDPDAMIVQFVVDTTGTPIGGSFKIL